MVVQAYILVQTDVGKAAEVAATIAGIKGVTRDAPRDAPRRPHALC